MLTMGSLEARWMVSLRARELRLPTLRLEQQARVLTAYYDNPPHQFMTEQAQEDLDYLTRVVDADGSVGAVVLTGAAPDRFMMHFDIASIAESLDNAPRFAPESLVRAALVVSEVAGRVPMLRRLLAASRIGGLVKVSRFYSAALRIMRSPVVYIAAINGLCTGGGCELALCFDIRIGADSDDVGFLLPELLIGLTTTVSAQRLALLLGPARAFEMLADPHMISAAEALELGLVNSLVAKDELLSEAAALARRCASRNRETVAAQKHLLYEGSLIEPAKSLRREGAADVAAMITGPARTALREWLRRQRASGGESAFLTDAAAWRDGSAVTLNLEP